MHRQLVEFRRTTGRRRRLPQRHVDQRSDRRKVGRLRRLAADVVVVVVIFDVVVIGVVAVDLIRGGGGVALKFIGVIRLRATFATVLI